MIIAKQYLQTGFSADDAKKLSVAIQPLLDKKEKIIIDFSGVKNFTTLFFNYALSRYVVEIGADEYERLFEIRNLSEIGEATYQHSLDNAKEYSALSSEQKETQSKILADTDDF
ncbi:MAG: STAS-like domain-containing protein [Lachnoclostridium sp.]|jgi:hypothetical protein|nr:STAS-like domain-containing protein [Lachnoclostridium sp.]